MIRSFVHESIAGENYISISPANPSLAILIFLKRSSPVPTRPPCFPLYFVHRKLQQLRSGRVQIEGCEDKSLLCSSSATISEPVLVETSDLKQKATQTKTHTQTKTKANTNTNTFFLCHYEPMLVEAINLKEYGQMGERLDEKLHDGLGGPHSHYRKIESGFRGRNGGSEVVLGEELGGRQSQRGA